MSYLSKVALALAASGAVASTAVAGGPSETVTEPAVVAKPAFSWEGFYVGGHIAHKRAKAKGAGGNGTSSGTVSSTGSIVTGTPLTLSAVSSASGLSGSVFFGHNWVSNGHVFGLEAELGSGGKDIALGADRLERGVHGAFRLRAGTAIDSTLLYLAGGVAASRVTLVSSGTSDSRTMTGWTVAIGAERAFSDHWLGRVELNHTDYGKKSFASGGPAEIELKETGLRLGLAYKF